MEISAQLIDGIVNNTVLFHRTQQSDAAQIIHIPYTTDTTVV